MGEGKSPTSERVLKILADTPEPVSGTVLARRLGVSRTAIWKAVQSLEREGYEFRRFPRRGYRLVEFPDRLVPSSIRWRIGGGRLGRYVVHFDRVDSTNRVAKERAAAGAEEGTLVIAEEQTRGRGRLDRSWVSPPGLNLLFSLIFRPPLAPQQVFRLNMVASVSVVEALRASIGLASQIKWPNDIYLSGKKVGGLLTEFSATADRVDYAVVGIGLNVNMDPQEFPELAGTATSLRVEAGRFIRRLDVLGEILVHMDAWYEKMCRHGEGVLRDRWNRYSLIIGRRVEVVSQENVRQGRAETIDEDGALILTNERGETERVVCGDVSLRPL